MGDSGNKGAATGPLRRLVHSLANLTASIVEIAETRLALLGNELQEEVYRAAGLLLLAVSAIFLGTLGLAMAAFALVIAFWDMHRLLVSILVSASFLAISLTVVAILVVKLRSRPPMLENALAELGRDRRRLRGEQ